MKDVPLSQLFRRSQPTSESPCPLLLLLGGFVKGLCQPHILSTAFLLSIALPPLYTQDGYDILLSHVGPEAAFFYAPAGQLRKTMYLSSHCLVLLFGPLWYHAHFLQYRVSSTQWC